MRLVDVRHEQTATFAAEGWAKVTRRLGCAALTAGPGRDQRRERDDRRADERLAGGRARRPRAAAALGCRLAAGARPRADRRVGRRSAPRPRRRPNRSSTRSTPRAAAARTPHRGPDVRRHPARRVRARRRRPDRRAPRRRSRREPDARRDRGAVADAGRRVASVRCCSPAATSTGRTPRSRCAAFVEAARVPVFVNGMGRGTLPADHELAFSRARSLALKEADLVLVAGTPLDFRLGFGRFGDAQVVHLVRRARSQVAAHADARRVDGRRPRGDVRGAGRVGRAAGRARRLGRAAARRRAGEARGGAAVARRRHDADQARAHLRRAAQAARPRRDRDRRRRRLRLVRGQVRRQLRAGHVPRPGPVRMPRHGTGLRARGRARRIPTARSCCCSATARSASRSATSRRSCGTASNVVAIVGNNGIWGLEKHPMQALFGYDVVAELRPGSATTRSSTALGGHGELVDRTRRDRPRARPRVRDAAASRW